MVFWVTRILIVCGMFLCWAAALAAPQAMAAQSVHRACLGRRGFHLQSEPGHDLKVLEPAIHYVSSDLVAFMCYIMYSSTQSVM